ncbi:MAG: restriction endonuclease subunit S [Methylococcales bacterium]|nr:restriction endonuclease subunit S [Methylococcales bacterium]
MPTMKIKFDVTPKELLIVRDILAKYLQEDCTVWIFGSRAKSSSLVGSDLDLALECKDKIALKLLTQLKIAFEDSRLPYRVDVIDMHAVKPYFKEIIDKEKIVFPLKAINKKVPVLRFPEFSGDWEGKSFKQLVKLQRGSSPRPIVRFVTKSDDGVNWIKIGDTKLSNIYINSTAEKITKKGAEKSRKVNVGEIILSNSMSYGKPYILNIDGYIHDGWFVLRDYEKNFNKAYLRQLLGSELVQKQYKRLAAGGVVSNISSELVNSVKINLPAKLEQQKIADFLTQIDRKIEQLSKKKQLLERYKKGVMQKVFSQALRFKDDNGNAYPDWEVKRLGDVTKIYDGTHMTPDYKKEGIPFYSVEHLTSNNFFNTKFISKEVFEKENKRVKLEKGDILMTKIGDIGTSKYINWDVNASFYVSLALIKKTEINNTLFINQYIKSSLFQKELHKRIIHVAFPKKINLGEISHCLINFPCLEEQTKIANFLTELDQKINLVEKQLNGTKDYKKGLLQQMFI